MLTSYLVANAVILPASNWFARRFGRKRFLLTCVVIFTVASFFCGAAPSLGVILLARVLQGAGGGALQPLVAVDPAGELSASEAIDGHGGLWAGDRGGAGAGADAGRLADRYLQLAVRVLHQHPGGHSGGDPDRELRPRSAVHQKRQSRRVRQYRLRAADGVDGLPADGAGQGAGGRLVWRAVGALGGGSADGGADWVDLAVVDQSERAGGSARTEEPQLPDRVFFDCAAGDVHLHHDYDSAALLPGGAGVHGVHGRAGGGAARGRIVYWLAGDRHSRARASTIANCCAWGLSDSACARCTSAW